MTDPYHWLSTPLQWLLLAIVATATLYVGQQLGRQGRSLTTSATPYGILDIEFPWSEQRAKEVIGHWSDEKLLSTARDQVIFDFLYLLLYPVSLSLLCALIGGHAPGVVGFFGSVVAWGVLLMGPLDAIENLAILRMLSGSFAAPLPQLATIAATLKFTLLFGAFFYIAVGGFRTGVHLVKTWF